MKPALARHGLRITDEVRVSPTRGLDQAGPSGSQNGAAVLRFQTSGITHVLFLGYTGSPPFFFMKAAEGQNYYPQYGLNTNDGTGSLATNVNEQTLRNWWGVGWFPMFDLVQIPTGPAAAACKSLMAKAGQPAAYDYCDSFAVLVAGATAGGAPLSVTRMLTGLDTVGRLNLAEFTLGYGPGRPDGIVQARTYRYQTRCSCLQYTSAPYPVTG
jgi:hypothetical protein